MQTLMNQTSKEGMDWILRKVESLAQAMTIKLATVEWQADPAINSENYYLALSGRKGKRIMKLFSKFDLENCNCDLSLQKDVIDRLEKMIRFVAAG